MLWLTEQNDQRHRGVVELDVDRVRIYINDQIVADWHRSDVVFTGAGSRYGVSSGGESLVFEPESGSAFGAAAFSGGLAGRIAQVTQSGQVPTITRSQPAPLLPLAAVQPKKKRRWPWVVGILILIGMIANAGEDSPPSTVALRSSESTSPSPTTVSDGSERCRLFATQLLPLILDTSDAMDEAGDAASAAADGDISYIEASSVFSDSADTFGETIESIRDLGTPPAELATAVTLFTQALNTLEAAYEMASIGAQTLDVDMIDEATEGIVDGGALAGRASEAIQGC